MAAEILITSEKFVKEATSVSDNINAKYLRPSIREAQEVAYKRIVGACLLDKLKGLVAAGTIDDPENAAYKALLDNSQYFLAYTAIVEVAVKVAYKVANIGVAKTQDNNIYPATQDEISKMRYYYQAKADSACYELQGWIIDNRADLPELSCSCCRRIRSNLWSAATCGIWLGGARGKGDAICAGCPWRGRKI